MKRVLLFHPKKSTDRNNVPHLGLGMLAAVLKNRGHSVRVLDSLLFIDKEEPDLISILKEFRPDVIGISVYTSTVKPCYALIKNIRGQLKDIPILMGGPHVSLNADTMQIEGQVDYLVRGEAEGVICSVVENARRNTKPEIIDGKVSNIADLPHPDFKAFVNWEAITQYPLMTSRGCPFACRFCTVRNLLGGRIWRKRDIEDCIREVIEAAKLYPHIRGINIPDDAPTTDTKRFKLFLHELIRADLRLNLQIDNLRADSLDEGFVTLVKNAGATSLCMGVEHADPEVFEYVNKGESQETIERAARLIKKGGLQLGLCFIIGLPKDSLEKTRASIDFAKSVEADFMFWNIAHPMKGTEIRDWYLNNKGSIYDDADYTSYDYHTLRPPEPIVETPEFTREERKKAYFWAVVETDQYTLTGIEFIRLFILGVRYNLFKNAMRSMGRQVGKKVKRLGTSIHKHVKKRFK